MGIILAFLSVFSYSVANLFWKKAAVSSDLVPGFVFQYGLVTVFSVFFGLLSMQDFFGWSSEIFVVAAILGISWYIGIFAYLKSSRHMPMSVSLAIAYGYVIVLYFVNAEIFPSEALSPQKLAIAGLFFASIAAFLVSESKKGGSIARYAWLPGVALLSWTVYFWTANYVVKTELTSPVWSLFLAEGAIFAMACAVFALRSLWRIFRGAPFDVRTFWLSNVSSFLSGVSMAIFLALGTGFLLVSYSLIPANLANTVGLFTTVVTAVLSSWLFRERLRSTEWWLIAISTILLCVFIILP